MNRKRKYGGGLAVTGFVLSALACGKHRIDYSDDDGTGGASIATGGAGAAGSTIATGGAAGAPAPNGGVGAGGSMVASGGALPEAFWPDLPSERGTVTGIEPFVFEDTSCTTQDFPVGSGERWAKEIPSVGDQDGDILFPDATWELTVTHPAVNAPAGARVALWETELDPPEGFAASPVYWLGLVGGPPAPEGLLIHLSLGMGVSDPEKVKYYFSEDGAVYAPLTSEGTAGVVSGSGYLFLGSEAGGWVDCDGESGAAGASN